MDESIRISLDEKIKEFKTIVEGVERIRRSL